MSHSLVAPFSGRATWTIGNEGLSVTLLQSGGHVGEMTLIDGEGVSPLWVPAEPTIDSDAYDSEIHGEIYGRSSESRLLSGLVGHNLCFPFWGNPSASESAASMTFHGESNIRRWALVEESPGEITIEVALPESALKMRRHFRLRGHALHCFAEATNLSRWDRPFGWCEHVTLGPPFLESAAVRFDASAGAGFITGKPAGLNFRWPQGGSGGAVHPDFDLSKFTEAAHEDLVNSFVVEANREWGFFTAFNRKLGLLFGYVFPASEFPWLNVWESSREQRQTRGMEFSNTPHHGTMKALVSASHIRSVPAYEWLDALSTVSKRFIAFSHPLPMDYQGTADIRVESDALQVMEHGAARLFQIPA